VELGLHLPLIDFRGEGFPPRRLIDAAEAAREAGLAAVAANDHLVFSRPWLDGLSALAAVVEHSGAMALATTTALPVVRGPVQTAKSLAALDLLSGGRLEASLGPGSSHLDYEAAGIPFEERWPRYEESLRIVRGALRGEPVGELRFYPEPPALEPPPARPVPIWVASWGSEVGLRRAARLGDGWLASAYNTTPRVFAQARAQLAGELAARDREGEGFPAALATMWTWVAESSAEAEAVLRDVLAPLLRRDPEQMRDRVAVGPAQHVAELLESYARAGCDRLYLWPLADEVRQLTRVVEGVLPLAESVTAGPPAKTT
jgi:alkanesulfonate monooxygenase SsuD/methylene tetrahydromethanopterin reductase-like flavin-dependent oxidoreductase (luciferase family)